MGGSSPVYRIAKLQWFLLVRNRGMAPRVISRFIYTVYYRIYIYIYTARVLYKNALYKNLRGSVPQNFGFVTNSRAVWFAHIKPKDISSIIHHNSNLAYSSYVYQCFTLYPTARPGFPSLHATCLRQFGAQAPTCTTSDCSPTAAWYGKNSHITEHPTGPKPKTGHLFIHVISCGAINYP